MENELLPISSKSIDEKLFCFNLQGLFIKSTLDSVVKVVLGVELDSVCGTNEEGTRFSDAFDEASALTFYRYVDIFWKIKRLFNIGSEAVLKERIKEIDTFVSKIITRKSEEMHKSQEDSHVSY